MNLERLAVSELLPLNPAAETASNCQAPGPMSHTRRLHALLKLEDGSILACGGLTTECEKYDAMNKAWVADISLSAGKQTFPHAQLNQTSFWIGRKQWLCAKQLLKYAVDIGYL